MRRLLLCLCMLWLCGSLAVADTDYSIDVKEGQCIEADSSTAGMANCTMQAQEAWDREMNTYYELLMKKLNKDQSEKLRHAQRAWLEYRDKEFKNIATFFSTKVGTMWGPIRVAHYRDIVKQRVLELMEYHRLLEY